MNHSQLVEIGLNLAADVGQGQTAVSAENTTLVTCLYWGPQLSVHLIARLHPFTQSEKSMQSDMARQIAELYDKEDLRFLCMDLGSDYENMKGEGKQAICLSLVEYMWRRGRLPDLASRCKTDCPHADWTKWEHNLVDDLPLAVVVDMVSRERIYDAVPKYLDEQPGMQANVLWFHNPDENKHLSLEDEENGWERFPVVFNSVLSEARQLTKADVTHFFLAAPGPILFGMGCMWGTTKTAVCYHFQNDTYQPVIEIANELMGQTII